MTNPAINQMMLGAGPSSGGGGVGANGGRIHLSPHFPSSVPRHGSLPNVNAGSNIQVHLQKYVPSLYIVRTWFVVWEQRHHLVLELHELIPF